MKKDNFEIVYISPHKIKTNPLNSKIHTAEQIQQIKQSVEEFGFNDPIAVDQEYNIIEGHGRLIAAIDNKMDEVPVFIIPNLTHEQRIAYSIIHNKLTNDTDFDRDILAEEISHIQAINMSKYSFNTEIESMFDEDIQHVSTKERKQKQYVIAYPEDQNINKLKTFLDAHEYKYKQGK